MINWTTKSGQKIEVNATSNTTVSCHVDGKRADGMTLDAEITINGKTYPGKIGKVIIPTTEIYNQIKAEMAAVPAAINHINGVHVPCSRCGTYCHGDCKQ